MRMSSLLLVAVACSGPIRAQAESPFAQAVSRYETASAGADRIAALDEIAGFTGSIDAGEITRALAEGLTDEQPEVRKHAVALVAKVPDRDAAVEALVRACLAIPPRLRAIERVKVSKLEVPEKISRKSLDKFIDEGRRNIDDIQAMLQKMKAATAEVEPLTEALLTLRTDRAVDGLAELLTVSGHGENAAAIRDALLEDFGTRAALAVVAEHTQAHKKWVDAAKKAHAKAKRTRKKPEPKYWKGTRAEWKERERERVEKIVRGEDEKVRATEQRAVEYLDPVRAFAEARGLPAAPRGSNPSAWRSWARSAGKRLPEHVADDGATESAESRATSRPKR